MFKSITANLMVDSVEETVKFYEEILGFVVVASVPHAKGYLQFAILAKENLMLMCQEKGNLIEEYPSLSTEKVQPSISLYITVDQFDETYREITAKQEPLVDVHETFYGTKEFAIADNNGYVITIAEARG